MLFRSKDVDFITTSIQSVATGGVGLRHPLAGPNFRCFDLDDARHSAISHHLAHALSAFALCPTNDATVVVHDRAGSSTRDGRDFYMPFSQWATHLTTVDCDGPVKSENISIYSASEGLPPELKFRSFCVPHVQPSTFVDSACALYDNVSRHVFGSSDAHGQLMALAGLPEAKQADHVRRWQRLMMNTGNRIPSLRNGWQALVKAGGTPESYVSLARATQETAELILVWLVEEGVRLTGKRDVAAAGGAFLNVVANTSCASSANLSSFFVPPAPHDAGISVGCAYAPFYLQRSVSTCGRFAKRSPTRLGPQYSDTEALAAVAKVEWALSSECKAISPEIAASLLHGGEVMARCAGRSEFGPRALGGRSLLASPFVSGSAARLNRIKKRQSWRPVAPVTTEEAFSKIFDGPVASHMQFTSKIKPPYAHSLREAMHCDGTARPQSLDSVDDPWLYALLACSGKITGVPVLLNTSLNTAGQPIVESFEDALSTFLLVDGIDSLLLNEYRVMRRDASFLADLNLIKLRMVSGVSMSTRLGPSSLQAAISLGALQQAIPVYLAPIIAGALVGSDVADDWTRLSANDRARSASVLAALKLLGFVIDVEFDS